jgi:cytochrome oxidase assembly protein ShyY1
MRLLIPPRRILGGLTLIAVTICFGMALWQLSRLQARRQANAAALAQRDLPTIVLDSGASGRLENRRVRAEGHYDLAHPILLRQFYHEGAPGVRVVMPLVPSQGDTATLVLRGFLPSPDGMRVDLTLLPDPGDVVVEGVAFRIPETSDSGGRLEDRGVLTWRRLDRGEVSRLLPYPVREIYVIQERLEPTGGRMFRLEPPPLDDGPHLSYAFQWTAFGVTALVVGWLLARRTED